MKKKYSLIIFFRALIIGLIVFISYSIGMLPSIFTGKFFIEFLNFDKITHLIILPLFIFIEFFILIISEILVTSIFVNLFRIKYKEGVYEMSLEDKMFYKFSLFSMLYLPIIKVLKLLCLDSFGLVFVKLLGAKIGKNVILIGRLNDPCLTEIGEGSVIGGHSIISAHAGEKKLFLKKVKIGNNCIVGGWAHIMPGVIMEDNSALGARSLATKNQKLLKGKIYGGIPAKEIKK